MTSDIDEKVFDQMPRFDARDFQPPAWATGPELQWGRRDLETNGESSKLGSTNSETLAPELDEEEEVWEDAEEDLGVDASGTFTTAELKRLLGKATELKTKGNAHFTSKSPEHERAVEAYHSALALLPPCPRHAKPRVETTSSGIEEVTDDQAEKIVAEEKAKELNPEESEREEVEEEIRECTKACWGNLAACYLALQNDKEAINACSEALKVDPNYVKALQRRATANERISSWSSLTTAQEDYTLLLKLLPASSPHVPAIRRSLSTLPSRIQVQQEKEKDEMLAKLKELGNGLLGKFGLSTDMFKFDPQPGGGYNMRFER